MKRLNRVAHTVVCALAIWTGSVSADAVTEWNEITMAAVTASRPGPAGMLDVALVQVAVHDAVQAIDRRYEPYHVEIKGAKGSRSAAVAAATRDVLAGMYPDPAKVAALDAVYFNYLAEKGLSSDPGLQVGQRVAAGILPLRRQAPSVLPPPFTGGQSPGVWRPTESFNGTPPAPPSMSPMLTPWLADVDPFTLTGPMRFRAEPPPALTSARYAKDYAEVKALGALSGGTRTPEQMDIAYFYSENFFAQWNRALRAIAEKNVYKVGDSARLFALANLCRARQLSAPGGVRDPEVLNQLLRNSERSGPVVLDTERGSERWHLHRQPLAFDGEAQVLLVLSPLEQALESESLHAWRQLVQVLTHEIMNSLTPGAQRLC